MARPGAGGEYADPCVACQVAATLGHMLLDALVRTSPADAPLVGPARTLLAVARGAAAVGATLVLVGLLSLALAVSLHGLSTDTVLGGAVLALAGGLGVVAQGHLARWIEDRRPRSLQAASWCGVVAAVTAWLGWGMLVGFSWLVLGLAGVVAVAQAALVSRVDPRASLVAPGPGRGAPGLDVDEWTLLRWTAQAAAGLGVAVGGASAVGFVHYALTWQQDWNLIGAYVSGIFVVGSLVWTVPPCAILSGTGAGLRSALPAVLAWSGVWVVVALVAEAVAAPLLLMWVIVGGLAVVEVALGCLALWRRAG
ncbi:hypothetical protein IEQ44_04405 [Nocardioides sp. Y6]|uniref:Integral membrane protein n=1 Tax=Nocardioides malaquae TaxID=2773426 RepID=A0ABR9RQN8_9ACTN|nr:hypothetical protein [Nocardioides malaquae]MBE7323890.1 hypothetical protein [Nocardioides malaquae]